MLRNENNNHLAGTFILLLVIISACFLEAGFTRGHIWYWGLAITLPLILLTLVLNQTRSYQKTNLKMDPGKFYQFQNN